MCHQIEFMLDDTKYHHSIQQAAPSSVSMETALNTELIQQSDSSADSHLPLSEVDMFLYVFMCVGVGECTF